MGIFTAFFGIVVVVVDIGVEDSIVFGVLLVLLELGWGGIPCLCSCVCICCICCNFCCCICCVGVPLLLIFILLPETCLIRGELFGIGAPLGLGIDGGFILVPTLAFNGVVGGVAIFLLLLLLFIWGLVFGIVCLGRALLFGIGVVGVVGVAGIVDVFS